MCKCVFSRISCAIEVVGLFASLDIYNQLLLFAASCIWFCSDPQEMVLQLLKSLLQGNGSRVTGHYEIRAFTVLAVCYMILAV